MRRTPIILFLFLLIGLFVKSQENKTISSDTTTLAHALRKGKLDLYFRFYYMHTNNEKTLSDCYAYAVGGGMKYETGGFKKFSIGIGGFSIWNIGSSNLTVPDSITGMYNRYESGQFDVEDLSNKNNMNRIEALYIKYKFPKSTIVLGKQQINTPFINPQDGRMRHTVEQGVWLDIQSVSRTRILGGWLTKISPRGTVKWFDIDESIGVYSSGVNTSGTKSNYKGNLSSRGTGIIGLEYLLQQNWTVRFWEFYTENIFNTVMLQSEGEWKINEKGSAIAAGMFIHQDAVNYGGNIDPLKTYFDPSQSSNIFSGRLGYRQKSSLLLLNYTRISGNGRFLFPREWGREPMYTFLRRERNEGTGNVNAYSVNLFNDFAKNRLKTELGYGYYKLPGVTDYRLNKYGLPSYHQALFDIQYSLAGLMNGLELEFLYTYKWQAEFTENPKAIINKVNMGHVNFIVNYRL